MRRQLIIDYLPSILTLMMTFAQVFETSVTVNDNSPFQDYPHPDDHTTRLIILSCCASKLPVAICTPGKDGHCQRIVSCLRVNHSDSGQVSNPASLDPKCTILNFSPFRLPFVVVVDNSLEVW